MKKPKSSLPVSARPVQSPEQIQQLIRQRAYELYEQRGREDGRDFDDWIAAESEVTRDTGILPSTKTRSAAI
jgi:Protein of unknown function (DUF2934)